MSEYWKWKHPVTAEIMSTLIADHCDFCEAMATGIQPWHSDPNTVQGREQLDEIGQHIWDTSGTSVNGYQVRDNRDPGER